MINIYVEGKTRPVRDAKSPGAHLIWKCVLFTSARPVT